MFNSVGGLNENLQVIADTSASSVEKANLTIIVDTLPPSLIVGQKKVIRQVARETIDQLCPS